jgi:hypothetical protein
MDRRSFAWHCLLWFALLWWQGGFMFYSAIVVYIATDIVGMFEQGKVTARVMLWLNGLGTFAILLMFVDIAWWRYRPRGFLVTWFLLAGCQLSLWFLREAMVDNVDLTEERIIDYTLFRQQHEWYMKLTTAQWGCSLAWMAWLIRRNAGFNPLSPPLPSSSPGPSEALETRLFSSNPG